LTIQRMLELLEIEHECMLRGAHDDCDRNCCDCELVQDDYELHEMYTDVISLLKKQEPLEPKKVKIDQAGPLYHRCYCSKCGHYVGNMINNKVADVYENYCSNCGHEVKWK